jgi:uncharacterized protein YbaR (Trm112 family)
MRRRRTDVSEEESNCFIAIECQSIDCYISVDPQLLQRLICPRHRTALLEDGSRLRCEDRHEYPVVEDIPVILDEGPQTLWVAEASLNSARQNGTALDPYYVDTIGIADDEKAVLRRRLLDSSTEWLTILSTRLCLFSLGQLTA